MTLLIIGFLGFVGFVFVVANWKAKSAMKEYKLDRLRAGLDVARKRDDEWIKIDKKTEDINNITSAMRWWDRRMRK
jgi:hypothetical protein